MKKIRRFNVILLILMGLAGVCLGGSVALLILFFHSHDSLFVIIGLGAAILVTAITLSLPFLVHERDNRLHQIEVMVNQFGKEVSFLPEKRFLKVVAKRRKPNRIYALYLSLNENIGVLQRKEVGYALAQAIETHVAKLALIGYSDRGEFLFYTLGKEADLLSVLSEVDAELLANSGLVTYSLLIGASSSDADLPTMINEATIASLQNESRRDSLSLLVYSEEKEEKEIDLERELEQGRLYFSVYPFGNEDEIPEEKVNLLCAVLYDPYRGDTSGKDLFHTLGLMGALQELDRLSLDRGISYLKEEPESGILAITLSSDSSEDPSFLAALAKKVEEAGVPFNRIALCYSAVTMNQKKEKEAMAKAHGMGFRLGVYEYGGEAIDPLISLGVEVAFLKTEVLRESANPEYRKALVSALFSLDIKPLIEAGKAGCELSALPGHELRRLPDEEKPVEQPVAEEVNA